MRSWAVRPGGRRPERGSSPAQRPRSGAKGGSAPTWQDRNSEAQGACPRQAFLFSRLGQADLNIFLRPQLINLRGSRTKQLPEFELLGEQILPVALFSKGSMKFLVANSEEPGISLRTGSGEGVEIEGRSPSKIPSYFVPFKETGPEKTSEVKTTASPSKAIAYSFVKLTDPAKQTLKFGNKLIWTKDA